MKDVIVSMKNGLNSIPDFLLLDEGTKEICFDAFKRTFFAFFDAMPDAANLFGDQKVLSCGRVFAKGDVIYRCKDCTHDDTCVLCSACFNESDHIDHRVHFSISNGSGGSCDCGEDESWNRPLNCPIHLKGETSTSCDRDSLIKINHLVKLFFSTLFAECLPSWETNLMESEPTGTDVGLVLFNDEEHSFDDVIEILIESNIVSTDDVERASYIAQKVDLNVLYFDFICIDF